MNTRPIAYGLVPIIAISLWAGLYFSSVLYGSSTTQELQQYTPGTSAYPPVSCCSISTVTTTYMSENTTFGNASLSSSFSTLSNGSVSMATILYHSEVLTTSKTVAYNGLPQIFIVGNFTIHTAKNVTVFTRPQANETVMPFSPSSMFQFNVTSPEGQISYVFFGWTPGCFTDSGMPCKTAGANWTLPQPNNSSVIFYDARLFILWYTNSTGLYVSFQEFDTVANLTTMAVTTFHSCVSTLTTETIIGVSSVPVSDNNGGATTYTTWTTTYNPQQCG
jgi:hypothetical protein